MRTHKDYIFTLNSICLFNYIRTAGLIVFRVVFTPLITSVNRYGVIYLFRDIYITHKMEAQLQSRLTPSQILDGKFLAVNMYYTNYTVDLTYFITYGSHILHSPDTSGKCE
jgi:hypothetical protein